MNTSKTVCLMLLVVWVACCGWWAYHYKGNDNRNLFAPNTMHKIQFPTPSPKTMDRDKELQAVLDQPVYFDEKRRLRIVRQTERHDLPSYMAKVNAEVNIRK
jgi:hypothetical protein